MIASRRMLASESMLSGLSDSMRGGMVGGVGDVVRETGVVLVLPNSSRLFASRRRGKGS